jgi:hypothetical protein
VGTLRAVATAVVDVRLLLAAMFALAYYSFVVLSGGDWMRLGRFVVPALPLMFLFPGYLLAGRRWTTWPTVTATTLVLVQLAGTAVDLDRWSYGTPALRANPPGLLRLNPAGALAGREWQSSAFERMNRIHLRDIPTITALDAVVDPLAASPAFANRPVVVMSGQMGMVAYHLVNRRYGRVRMLDRAGLVETTLTDCLGRSALRVSVGLALSYDEFAALLSEDRCSISPPDVLFDLPAALPPALEAIGYDLVYAQEGRLDALGFGRPLHAEQHIWVRHELIPLLGEVPVRVRLDLAR